MNNNVNLVIFDKGFELIGIDENKIHLFNEYLYENQYFNDL